MHHSNSNSTEAPKQLLLQVPRKNNTTNINSIRGKSKDYDDSLPSPLFYVSINNPCKDIIHIGANAEEYYHVELICQDNGIEYGIQAYGEEAKELYKEINRFTIAAATPSRHPYKEVEELLENDNKYQEEEQEKLKLVKKAIDCITDDCFDNGCVLIFKKLKNVCISKRKVGYV
jgi:hypothetical protein